MIIGINPNETDETAILVDIESDLDSTENEASKKDACLLVMGGKLNGTIIDLNMPETTFGRSADNTISLDFVGISRTHFKIVMKNDLIIIEDTDSRNGTFLNNQKLDSQEELQKGDIIKLGSIALKFLPKGDTERLTYDRLELEANTDGLTKCFNKSYFKKSLDLAVKKCNVTGEPLSLIIFDLDYFKNINDNYGHHDAGDYVLAAVSDVIRASGLRTGDIFARYGGDEFVILLPNTYLTQGFEIAERLRKSVENFKFIYESKEISVTVSIGVADYRDGVETGSDLFKRADNAVYKSKDGGRNQVNYYQG